MKTRLSKILFDKGWTEMELSRRTGLAQSYINRVKNSRIVPTVRTAMLICRALEVPVEEAFVYEDKPFGVTQDAYFVRVQAATAE
ncbi:MAG TPA: helix-turn-helix transcriptional regulator [Candidatus Binatia bacterium]|nr:helix-turn-helix transcriptional regulator [Candidatus Binatia bacterium]